MYRSRDLLFYTASLMIANDLMLLDRYLKYPSKEPDYRKGRSHLEFVTTIALNTLRFRLSKSSRVLIASCSNVFLKLNKRDMQRNRVFQKTPVSYT